MPFHFNGYTNFHDINLDWIVSKIKHIDDVQVSVDESETNAAASAAASQTSAEASQASAEASQASAEASQASAEDADQSKQDAAELVTSTNNRIDVLSARVDNIIPSGTQTEGNTELLDVRVEYDATVAQSAGDSVRDQVNELQNKVNTALYDQGYSYINNHKELDSAFYGDMASGTYFNDYLYDGGYIESVDVKSLDTGVNAYVSLLFVDPETYEVLKLVRVMRLSTMQNVPVNTFFDRKILIGLNAIHGTYAIDTNILRPQFRTTNAYAEGDTVPIVWGAANGLHFPMKINYKNNLFLTETKTYQLNKAFMSGDSITAGYPYNGVNPNYQQDDNLKWTREVSQKLHLALTQAAASGNGYVYSTGSANAYTITRDTDFSQYDITVYAWGTNDYGNDRELGTPEDGLNLPTVCSRIKWIINKIYNDNPKIIPIFITPINRTDRGTESTEYAWNQPNNAETPYTLKQMVDAIKATCDKMHVPCITTDASPFNARTTAALTVDGLHPNVDGYKKYGVYLAGQIGKYISGYEEPKGF